MKILASILMILTFQLNAGVHDISVKNTKGEEIKLAEFKNKALLIVNIATRCGYTGQLDDLEALYQKYKDKGLVVLGVPSNDFGSQTPENDEGVAKFCLINYGVTFPLSEKLVVKGAQKTPLFQTLVSESGGDEVSWNFEKFLIGPDGKFVKRFKSAVKPKSLEGDIEKVLP